MKRKEKQNEKENSYYRPAFGVKRIACTKVPASVSAAEPQYYNYGTGLQFRARPGGRKNVAWHAEGDHVRSFGVLTVISSWYYVRVATRAITNEAGYVSTGTSLDTLFSTGTPRLD